MDRRSILFVALCFLSLYLVNAYFDAQYREEVRTWQAQQKVKKERELELLKREVSSRVTPTSELPLHFLYGDSTAKSFLSAAVEVDGYLLTLPWNGEPPKEVYARPAGGSGDTQRYALHYVAPEGIALWLFHKGEEGPLSIDELPDLGKHSVLLIEIFPHDKENPFGVKSGEFHDGVLTLLEEKIEKLTQEVDPAKTVVPKRRGAGIIISKKDNRYLPAALYDEQHGAVHPLEDFIELAQFAKRQAPDEAPNGEQQYYVLENEYQQLVFTNIGAALVEINLPFKTAENPSSAVRPIEIDRLMAEHHSYNAQFPAHPYMSASELSGEPPIKHPRGEIGGYYPLIRRDLIEGPNKNAQRLNPRYYSMNLLSEFPEVAELNYRVVHFDKKSITFEAQQPHRKIIKTFSFPEDKNAPYCFNLSIQIKGDKRGLWLSSGVPEVELFSDAPAPALKYRITRNQKSSVELIDLPKESTVNSSINPDWLCNSNGFFGIILDPLSDVEAGFRATYVPGTAAPSRLVEIDQIYHRYQAKNLPGYLLMMPLNPSNNSAEFRIFAGPFSDSVLTAVDNTYADSSTGYSPDYIASQSYHGWFTFISEPFAKLLFLLMKFFYSLTGSWAFSIMLLTVALRIMLYPLNAWSTSSMVRMQQIGPEVTSLQEKYKKDPKRLQQELMALYREKKINPLSGCFPLLIQMPFLIGMFDLLKTTFALRGASFIPGWIDNLAAPDVLFSWQQPIFFIGTEFHLLPLLLGGVMFAQQRIFSPAVSDASQLSEQQRQQRTMSSMMSVVFTVMFYNFPSGLNLYWLSSTLLGIVQQWWTQRRICAETAAATVIIPAKGKKAPSRR